MMTRRSLVIAAALGVGAFVTGFAASRWLRAAPSAERAAAPDPGTRTAGIERGAARGQVIEQSSGEPADGAPDFRFVDQHGKEHRLSDWRGSARVVNFWATWCPPCVHEIPILIAVREAFRTRGVRFLGIAADEPVDAFAMARELGMNYPTMADMRRSVELMHAYGHPSAALPFTAFIDAENSIRARHVGALTLEQAREKIEILIS